MKYVLKNKTQVIFSSLIKDVPGQMVGFGKSGQKAIRGFRFKESLLELKSSIQGTSLLLKEIPRRINDGFKIFSEELIIELEKLPDQKMKTVFCMKVLAGLSQFVLSSAYEVGLGDVKLLGLGKRKIIYSRLIISKLLYKTIQTLILRFIQELEKEMTKADELEQLENLKKIILNNSTNAVDKFFSGITDPADRAFRLVENFKSYIFTGVRS
jgi:hypothetical protein